MSEPRGGSTTNPTRQPGQCGRSSPRLHALADIHPELPASDACGMGVDGGRALLRVLDEGGGGARGRDCAGDGGLPSVAPASAAAHEPAAQAGKLSPNDREPHRPASGGVSGPWVGAERVRGHARCRSAKHMPPSLLTGADLGGCYPCTCLWSGWTGVCGWLWITGVQHAIMRRLNAVNLAWTWWVTEASCVG